MNGLRRAIIQRIYALIYFVVVDLRIIFDDGGLIHGHGSKARLQWLIDQHFISLHKTAMQLLNLLQLNNILFSYPNLLDIVFVFYTKNIIASLYSIKSPSKKKKAVIERTCLLHGTCHQEHGVAVLVHTFLQSCQLNWIQRWFLGRIQKNNF